MSAIDELLRSPLDDEHHPSDKPWLGWLIGALVFVAGFAGGWALTSNLEGAESPSSTTSMPSEALLPMPPPGSIPISDGLSARVEAGFGDEAGTWFVVSLAADRDVGPEQVDGFIGGVWDLSFDGSSEPYVAEYFNPFYPGVFTVLFPLSEVPADGVLRVTPYSDLTRVAETRSAAFEGLPWSGQPVAPMIEINPGTNLVIETITVDQDGVSVRWRLDGDDEVLAALSLSGELVMDGREVALLRRDAAVDDQAYAFATTPSPPGFVSQPYRQPAAQSSGELVVPFYTGSEIDPEKEYLVRVRLSGSIAKIGTDEVTIPIDHVLADIERTTTAVTTTLPPTDVPQVISPPDASNGAMATTGRDHELVMFGGLNSAAIHQTTWLYDTSDRQWTEVVGADGPPARADQAMVFVPTVDRVLLFGGTAGFGGCDDNPECHDHILGDTWMWDPASRQWAQVATVTAPQARRGATMVYDTASDRIVLFGGEVAVSDTENGYVADTWTYDPRAGQWTELTTEQMPPPRSRHGMIYDAAGNRTLVFGGEGPSQDSDDRIWSLEAGSTHWVPLNTDGGPGPRWGFTFEYDPDSRSAILIGGAGLRLTPIEGGTRATSVYFADTWRFAPQTNAWTELSLAGDGGTWIRRTSAIDAATGVLVTFGGQAFSGPQTTPGAYSTGRTYHLDLATLTWR